jgi:diguanylate cyclase (GGDEF)-like protein
MTRLGESLPPEGAVTVGSLSIALVPHGEWVIATAREVAGLGRDALTGLLDRLVFLSHLEQAVAAGSRGHVAALLYIDIDQLKRVNDTGGHAAGDQQLIAFAAALQAAVRAEDVVARMGGDEFAVLMRNVDGAAVLGIARSVRDRLRTSGLSASIGAAIVDGSSAPADVMANADRACYAAKAKGGDTVELSA